MQAYCEHGAYVGLRRLPHGSLGEGKSGQTTGARAFLYTVSKLSVADLEASVYCQTNFLACI